ncbi:PLP-dependent aminotransferase family protein [Clostridium grantii]|uniref:Transcriptional regulator, GntR family n=1 Tax=Clostridium grantii DSM 8605 TaxID=1121316 RepID=A0A1M5WHW8_9CLOT|nr:PLP-dependent aminotransferase family protein [Clostridium grantii]SHH87095.1 transcriptional regulator, GntR family [Clostridium grantii DSM 8605]
MVFDFKINDKEKKYLQIYSQLKNMIYSKMLAPDSKLPSTRELSSLICVSRNSIMSAYELLEQEGLIYSIRNKGSYVKKLVADENKECSWIIPWEIKTTAYAKIAEKTDIIKNESVYKKGMISFKTIAPDENLFPIEEVKKSVLNILSNEGEKILNYGYAKGYDKLINFLLSYMTSKGVDTTNKSILITNGFTEGFDLTLSTILNKGDKILCENPTHNTALKIMKLQGLDIIGVDMTADGIDITQLSDKIKNNKVKAGFFVPSYHNPTGLVMSYDKRNLLYTIMKENNIPIIEDGFNEELQLKSDHISPLAAISNNDNSVIYIGSLSKILFPGLRIGWILGDKKLINAMESIKRSKNIHTSSLDQAILYDYLKNGNFEKYLKKIRTVYNEKFNLAIKLAKEYIPHQYITGDGGLYIFIKLKNIDARKLLSKCIDKGVIFTPGDIFYTQSIDTLHSTSSLVGWDTLRLGFSRLTLCDIEKGVKIIGHECLTL